MGSKKQDETPQEETTSEPQVENTEPSQLHGEPDQPMELQERGTEYGSDQPAQDSPPVSGVPDQTQVGNTDDYPEAKEGTPDTAAPSE